MSKQRVALASLPILLIAAACDTQTPTIDGDILGPDLNMVTPTQIVLMSGDGDIGTLDPLNQFTLDGGATFQKAWIISPHPYYHVIPGTKYINRNPDYTGPTFTTTRFKATFSLPIGFSGPSITVQVHADNVATVFLNGTQIGQQTFAEIFPNFQNPPESFTTTDASLFLAGTNSLEFDIHNFSGPTAFDYQAIVSFVPVVTVGIDIKPGSYPNCFNNNGNGVIPVAILGSETLDVSQIDPASVELAGMAVRTVGKADKLLAHIEDVSGPDGIPDGFADLVVQIQDEDGVFEQGEGIATVTGMLLDGRSFEGSDEICVTQ